MNKEAFMRGVVDELSKEGGLPSLYKGKGGKPHPVHSFDPIANRVASKNIGSAGAITQAMLRKARERKLTLPGHKKIREENVRSLSRDFKAQVAEGKLAKKAGAKDVAAFKELSAILKKKGHRVSSSTPVPLKKQAMGDDRLAILKAKMKKTKLPGSFRDIAAARSKSHRKGLGHDFR